MSQEVKAELTAVAQNIKFIPVLILNNVKVVSASFLAPGDLVIVWDLAPSQSLQDILLLSDEVLDGIKMSKKTGSICNTSL